ncbi:transmembrane protein 94-like protein l(2)k05819 isoform X3 [Dermatophagoides pteronyssinus]|uniref:transmembrane protein 94-like protein l(2)k05819 isoform X3 n=1 Tax=Dermatophagoides pteronyssinus TaxID=6956 RepID=UPI003F677134
MLEYSSDITGGLTTKQAVYKLYKDIKEFLDDLEQPHLYNVQSWRYVLSQAYSIKSIHSTFRWTSIIFLISSIITYLIAFEFGHFTSSIPLAIENVILVLVLILNIGIIYWSSKSRHTELYDKAVRLAEKIRDCANNEQLMNQWATHIFYANLATPASPCISIQRTYRDDKLVNLPVSLLVKGDVIYLEPGHKAPANCRRIDKVIKRGKKLNDYHFYDGGNDQFPHATLDHAYTYVFLDDEIGKDAILHRDEIFAPKVDNEPETFTVPRFRKSLKPSKFLLIETPYVTDLKTALSLQSQHGRKPTAFEKEFRLIFVRYLEHILVPIIFIIVLGFSIVHYCYVEFTGSHFDTTAATIALILLRPVMTILPLLPLALPSLWLILNVYGLIRLEIIYKYFHMNEDKLLKSGKSSDSFRDYDLNTNIHLTENPLYQNNSAIRREHLLEEIDPDQIRMIPTENLMLQKILKKIFFFFSNENGNLWRTANLLHVLGSITALCCVDKKGILSWPNPIADKVFFLSSAQNRKKNSTEYENFNNNVDNEFNDSSSYTQHNQSGKRHSVLSNVSRAECVQLDITLDRRNPYGLQFDDIYWNRYLSNLKPLGLAILLNTCNPATQEEFIRYSDHIACESLANEVAVPVVSKRCLCELARQIGFTENAIKDYQYCYQIGVFRHIRPEVIKKGKLAKSLNFSRLRMPFPNMTCAVICDSFSNTCQLLSQGTGDLILDSCAEYWNGQGLVLLTDYERKKILDFYQRSSLTSYCCSFSYIPVINESGTTANNSETSNFYKEYYVELPPDSSHLFPSQRSLDSHFRGLGIDSHYSFSNTSHHNFDSCNESFDHSMYLNLDSKLIGHHLSTDSISKHGTFTPVNNSNNNDSPSTRSKKGSKEDLEKPIVNNDATAAEPERSFKAKPIVHETQTQKLDQTMKKVINEVFIGMATLQYQACSDFVRLVELLDTACIRFVHFSKENELRSRVFSEKMGLESGWNCHISLLNDSIGHYNANNDNESSAENSEHKKSKHSDNSAHIKHKMNHRMSITSINSSDYSSSSDSEEVPISHELPRPRRKLNSVCSDRSGSFHIRHGLTRAKEFRSSSKASNTHRQLSPSPSRNTTASTMTEHEAPITFDMSNRAKLPKGIDNIRPHLENVDNVPLLVSLFTDCTPEATKEMIKIMQEYDEVVCVIGSMANESNMPIFMQADASIGIDPMYPHVCKTEPVRPIDRIPVPNEFQFIYTPTQLANELIALPCSMTMERHNAIIFYYLILIARDYMMRMRNVFQFFLSSCLSISLAQMITSLLFLPPLISPGIVLWLSMIVIPFLSVSLMGIKPDPTVMTVATGKKLHLNKESIVYFFLCYIIKFTPSVVICVIMFAIIIGTSCEQTKVGRSTLGPCWMFSDLKADGDIKTDLIWSSHLLIGQTIASLFLVLYLVIISIGFVHRNHLLWQRYPFVNYCWLGTSVILIFCHLIVCLIEIYIYVPEIEIAEHFIEIIPFYIWIIGFSWPILLMTINVFAKRREIKISTRQQRRARLDFGTKLGMNSPF